MPAPLGNDYWKKRAKQGPEITFGDPELLRKALIEYVELMQNSPIYSVEQTTGKGKPVYDDLTGEIMVPDPLTYIPDQRPLTLAGFSRYLGCSESYLRTIKCTTKRKDLLAVIDEIYNVIFADQQEGSLSGHYNANFSARLQSLPEITKNEHTGPNGEPLTPRSPLDDLTYEQLYQLKHGKLPPPKK